jgi:hypothetical protein
MNSFDNIIGQMTGSDNVCRKPTPKSSERNLVGLGAVSFSSASGESRGNGRGGNNNHSTQLEKMSESALNNILSTYRKDIASSSLEESDKSTLKSRIRMIESELSGRGKSSFSASVMEDTSSMDAQEKKYQLGAGVGTSSLIFGVLGFMTSSLMGSKHPFMWGIAGAGAGGTMAFFMSQDKSLKLINPIQEVK